MTSSTSRIKSNVPSFEAHLQSIRKVQSSLFRDVDFISVPNAQILFQEQKDMTDHAKVTSSGEKQRRRVLFVDCRSEEERKVSMIPGAVSKDDFVHNRNNVQNPLPENLVCYCTIGMRSGLGAHHISKILGSSSSKNGNSANDNSQCTVRNMEGGIIGWARAHNPLMDPGTEQNTTKLHTFSSKFDLVPSEYEVQHFSTLNSTAENLRTWWTTMKMRVAG
uniref:Rhodanese domain-containing protein n=1 Tax=Percolomonas cosmopolitus TaxID=63605 RepID=A0A7S1KSH1_9EUKA|mmetsp:Transcript_7074/g.26509  ORF Transcript_7074/g.26509 Transcript_7074/m.26509 type:complete len:220 (+) Transcript_7074:288-947(+)